MAIAAAAWPLPGFYDDTQAARTLDIAAQVLETRLVEQVRIAEGATYSPSADAAASQTFPHYGYLFAQVETPPAKIDGFYRDLVKIAGALAATPPTADELARAETPLVETIAKQRQSNEFWLQRLDRAWIDPRALDAIRSQLPDLRKVAPADIEAVARRYFAAAPPWRLVIRAPDPAPGTPGQAAIPVAPPMPGALAPAPVGTKTGAPSPTPSPTQPSPQAPLSTRGSLSSLVKSRG